MAGQTGRSFKMAFAKFGTNSWGVAASVTKGVYFESDGGLQYKPGQVTDNAFGQNFLAGASPGLVEAPALTFTGRSRYADHTYIWDALAMGSPATVAISTSVSGQTTSWLHVFDLADAIDGLGLTIAIDKNLYVDELTSAKVHGWEETQEDNGAMNISYKVLGSKPTPISSVNIAATVSGASYPALTNRIVQQQGVFRMNLQSGGALGASDAQRVESVKFSWERPQDAPHVYGQDYVDEPADNGFPTFQLEVTYPRMNTVSANSLYNALIAGTAWKADWTFTSGTFINSTDAGQKKYQFPYIELAEDGFMAATEGAQQVKPVAKFNCRLASAAPTGMTGVTRPFRLTRIMQNSVNAFA
jgi:hypothetical protein